MDVPPTPRAPLPSNVLIRPETAADIAAIEAVTIAAFAGHPHSDQTEHLVIRGLRAASALALSLVAVDDAQVVGHLAASPVTITDGTLDWFGLGPLSVLPSRQRCGIGSRLLHAALALLRQRGARGCVLVGDPAYYSRFGFRPEPTLRFPLLPAEFFQALAFAPALPSGVVTYHPAFFPSR